MVKSPSEVMIVCPGHFAAKIGNNKKNKKIGQEIPLFFFNLMIFPATAGKLHP